MKVEHSASHADLRTPKYKMRVVRSRKGKGSFKRAKRIRHVEM